MSLIDTGSTVILISESVIKRREYLSRLPIMYCSDPRIHNTSGEMIANRFIELCFRLKDDYILHTTALVVPNFDSVQFLLSISNMNQLNSVIDVNSRQISIRRRSFVFKTCIHSRIKVHDSLTICVKCILPKSLRNSDFVSKLFRQYINYLPLNFVLKFKKGKSFLKISNPHSKCLNLKANTALGSVCFDLI